VRPLAPGEEAPLPEFVTPFLGPPAGPQGTAKKESQDENGKPGGMKPQFVGPRGHELPK
jgi:hypothetical protein